MKSLALIAAVVLLSLCEVRGKLRGDECEVCISFLNKFSQRLRDRDIDMSSQDAIEMELMRTCSEATGRDERFCYYIGATITSATKLVKEVTRPVSFGKPAEKICEDLKKKDMQICELRYEKQIDLNNVDLRSLKVRELKKILRDWGEECKGCAEKTDFVDKIKQLMPAHSEL